MTPLFNYYTSQLMIFSSQFCPDDGGQRLGRRRRCTSCLGAGSCRRCGSTALGLSPRRDLGPSRGGHFFVGPSANHGDDGRSAHHAGTDPGGRDPARACRRRGTRPDGVPDQQILRVAPLRRRIWRHLHVFHSGLRTGAAGLCKGIRPDGQLPTDPGHSGRRGLGRDRPPHDSSRLSHGGAIRLVASTFDWCRKRLPTELTRVLQSIQQTRQEQGQ